MDRTNYILNLIVQTTGYYFEYSLLQIAFHTDAFGQLREGEGRAVDGHAAAAWWMSAWTIFYVSHTHASFQIKVLKLLIHAAAFSSLRSSGTGGQAGPVLSASSSLGFPEAARSLRSLYIRCWFPFSTV